MAQKFTGKVEIQAPISPVPAGKDPSRVTISLDGSSAEVVAGGHAGQDGGILLKDADGNIRFHFRSDLGGQMVARSSNGASIIVLGPTDTRGGGGGQLIIRDEDDYDGIHLDGSKARATVGSPEKSGSLTVQSPTGRRIHLDGDSGDILLTNADCAEDFDVTPTATVEPGMVMVIDDEGDLAPCAMAYDRRVAGVVSGAGGLQPGIVLDRHHSAKDERRWPIAMVGKVCCLVDASMAPVRTGDLLTSSPTRGHAMRVTDAKQAFGAVLGKALQPVPCGRACVPILVALQ